MCIRDRSLMIPLALSDSINPCTLYIYSLLLLAVALSTAYEKRKILFSGIAFILGVYIAYYCLGVGLVQATTYVPKWIGGIVAVAFGTYIVITGLLRKPRIICKSETEKAILKYAKSYGLCFLLGVLVSLTLLPCSAGPYIIFAFLINSLEGILPYILLALYNAIFVSPFILILGASTLVLKGKMGETIQHYMRELSIVSGIILILVGLALF